jgi:copper chaperone NosL
VLSRRRFLVLLGAAGVTAGGIAAGVAALPDDNGGGKSGPPNIRYGEDACDTCRMIIVDTRHAAAWRDGRGGVARFDDIGCMVTLLRNEDPGAAATLYVHDFDDESWLQARDATFVISPEIKSPMAYGIAAFATRRAAEAAAASYMGQVYDWSGVVQHASRGGSM